MEGVIFCCWTAAFMLCIVIIWCPLAYVQSYPIQCRLTTRHLAHMNQMGGLWGRMAIISNVWITITIYHSGMQYHSVQCTWRSTSWCADSRATSNRKPIIIIKILPNAWRWRRKRREQGTHYISLTRCEQMYCLQEQDHISYQLD